MILPIIAYGDPVLRKVGIEIDKDYPNLAELIENMKETMENFFGYVSEKAGRSSETTGRKMLTDIYVKPIKGEAMSEAAKSRAERSMPPWLLEEYKGYPILRDGFEDFSNLDTYQKEISKLLDVLFPELLLSNEIKAATIPFEFTTFKLSNRFKQILEHAGKDYELTLRNFDDADLYIMTCTFILAFCHDVHIDFKRPFYFDIPNKKTGLMRHYRSMYNGDFFKVKALDNAPIITDEDVHLLLDNFDNLELWKEKFPIHSYEFKGFGLVNLFDVTPDELISNLKEDLIKGDKNSKESIEAHASTGGSISYSGNPDKVKSQENTGGSIRG